jgi:hypothetical protein
MRTVTHPYVPAGQMVEAQAIRFDGLPPCSKLISREMVCALSGTFQKIFLFIWKRT